LCLDQRSCFIVYKLYDYYTKIQRIRFPLLIYPFHGMITEIQRFQNDYTIHFRGFFDGALSLYLARSHTNLPLTSARFISGSSSALRAPDGRSHQRNFHLIIYNGRRLPHRLPGSRTFRPFSRNPLRHRQPSD